MVKIYNDIFIRKYATWVTMCKRAFKWLKRTLSLQTLSTCGIASNVNGDKYKSCSCKNLFSNRFLYNVTFLWFKISPIEDALLSETVTMLKDNPSNFKP